jgi:hypothetical protein
MRFTGKILEGGQVVLDRVTGEWDVDPSRRLFSWRGHFTAPTGQSARPGTFELHMDVGHKGTIQISQIPTASDKPPVVHFLGLGPLQ